MEAATLADRPDLFDAAFDIEYAEDDGSAFMQWDMAAILTRASRLAERWAEQILVLVAPRP